MKQRLLVFIVASVLITAPAFAGTVSITPTQVTDIPASFGVAIGPSVSTTTNMGVFTLSFVAQAYQKGSVFTYVYEMSHDSTENLVLTTIFGGLFDSSLLVGYVGPSSLNPFVLGADPQINDSVIPSELLFELSFDNTGSRVVFAQSYYGPVEMIVYSGVDSNFETAEGGLTIGPGDSGSGSALDPIPEPASILLLTSGLLGGVFLKFRKKSKGQLK